MADNNLFLIAGLLCPFLAATSHDDSHGGDGLIIYDCGITEEGEARGWRPALRKAYEDFMDMQIAVKAIEEHEKDPVSYSLDEVIRMNGDGDLLGDE